MFTLEVKLALVNLLKMVVLLSCEGQPVHSEPAFQRRSTV